jgi:CHAT domain-containing protein
MIGEHSVARIELEKKTTFSTGAGEGYSPGSRAKQSSTGETQGLYGESRHLVSACQLAGFQQVVGSLWEVSDMYSVDAAREVYEAVKDGIGSSDA